MNIIDRYREKLAAKASKIPSKLRDWARWEHNGRIYVGYKRINCEPLENVYGMFRFTPLSTIEILRRKVRIWLKA